MLESLLPNVIALAIEAGIAILQVYERADLGTIYKSDASPLTDADLASHHLILAGLNALTPNIPVLSEESLTISYDERQNWQHFWLVDPLDGTREFVKRNGQFTVNIALMDRGSPVLGVIHAPVLNTTYWAARNLGAFKRDSGVFTQSIQARPFPEPILKVVASGSHSDPRTQVFLSQLTPFAEQVEVLSMGSSLKSCLIAEGSAHLYPRFGPTMEWDTAAAECIVMEAGAKLTDMQGRRLMYNKPDLYNPSFIVFCQGLASIWPKLMD